MKEDRAVGRSPVRSALPAQLHGRLFVNFQKFEGRECTRCPLVTRHLCLMISSGDGLNAVLLPAAALFTLTTKRRSPTESNFNRYRHSTDEGMPNI